jgi:hypothetical protein
MSKSFLSNFSELRIGFKGNGSKRSAFEKAVRSEHTNFSGNHWSQENGGTCEKATRGICPLISNAYFHDARVSKYTPSKVCAIWKIDGVYVDAVKRSVPNGLKTRIGRKENKGKECALYETILPNRLHTRGNTDGP